MIRFGTLDFGKKERKAITDLISEDDCQLTMGRKVFEFEKAFAKWIGSKHAVMVNSGTSALMVALEAYNENYSHESLYTTALTYPATWNALKATGTTFYVKDVRNDFVMHCDIPDEEYYEYLSVDLLGKPCKTPSTIEDATESLGSTLNGQRLGTFGLMGVFSFYVAHQISTIEGGMVITNNNKLYDVCRSLRDNGRICICPVCTLKTEGICPKRADNSRERRWEIGTQVGYNFKPNEIQGVLGLIKMESIDENIKRRNKIFLRYSEVFKSLIQNENEFIVPIAYPVKVKNPVQAVAKLEKDGIEARGMFPSYHKFYTVATALSETHILIPLHHKMTDEEVEYVIEKVKPCL